MKIIRITIAAMPRPMPNGMFDPMPVVNVNRSSERSNSLRRIV